jgi:hypothetical protein
LHGRGGIDETGIRREFSAVSEAELKLDDWLDDGALTDAEKALIEQRFRDLEANPKSSIPWTDAKARLLAPFRQRVI